MKINLAVASENSGSNQMIKGEKSEIISRLSNVIDEDVTAVRIEKKATISTTMKEVRMEIEEVRMENSVAISETRASIFKILVIMGLIHAAEIICIIKLMLM